MAILDIARGQHVCIPTIRMLNGEPFEGFIRVSDGEVLVVEIADQNNNRLPEHIDEMCVLNWEFEGITRTCPILVRNHSPRTIVGQVVIQERREAPRLRVEMHLNYEMVPPGKVSEVAGEIMNPAACGDQISGGSLEQLKRTEDPIVQMRQEISALRDMLGELIMKVEDLATLVAGAAPPSVYRRKGPICIQNCSSTGIGLITAEPHTGGEYLRMQLTLRTTPKTAIDCMGVVVRCMRIEKRDDGAITTCFDIGVRFTHMHDSDRELLIQHLYQAQRRRMLAHQTQTPQTANS